MNTKHTDSVEATVEQYAQSIQDMYFLAGANISIETWKNTKDFIRNAITSHNTFGVTPDVHQIATAIKERYAECNGSYTPSELYEEVLKTLTTLQATHQQQVEEAVRKQLHNILALKVNMPSEREYSTNPTSAYRTGFETAVCMYRDRIKSLTPNHQD